jgi:hypothetical protein
MAKKKRPNVDRPIIGMAVRLNARPDGPLEPLIDAPEQFVYFPEEMVGKVTASNVPIFVAEWLTIVYRSLYEREPAA